MKVLVTGATSTIGKEVVSLILKQGHEVRILTRQQNISPDLQNTEVFVSDLSDAPTTVTKDIDTVIHIAAATPGANSSIESYHKTNVEGTKHLVEICEANKVMRFIFISSIVVLFKENNDAYTLSKKQAEEIITNSKLDWTILRPAEILGTDKSWDHFLGLLKTKSKVYVPGDGSQKRHPVFFKDVVNAIMQVISNTNTYSKKYTLAAAEAVGYYQYLYQVKKIFNLNFRIITVPIGAIKLLTILKPVFPDRVKRKISNAYGMLRSIELDIKDGISDFNYSPYSVEEGFIELKRELDSR